MVGPTGRRCAHPALQPAPTTSVARRPEPPPRRTACSPEASTRTRSPGQNVAPPVAVGPPKPLARPCAPSHHKQAFDVNHRPYRPLSADVPPPSHMGNLFVATVAVQHPGLAVRSMVVFPMVSKSSNTTTSLLSAEWCTPAVLLACGGICAWCDHRVLPRRHRCVRDPAGVGTTAGSTLTKHTFDNNFGPHIVLGSILVVLTIRLVLVAFIARLERRLKLVSLGLFVVIAVQAAPRGQRSSGAPGAAPGARGPGARDRRSPRYGDETQATQDFDSLVGEPQQMGPERVGGARDTHPLRPGLPGGTVSAMTSGVACAPASIGASAACRLHPRGSRRRVLHLADEELPSNGCGDSRGLGGRGSVDRDALEVGAIRIVQAPRPAPTRERDLPADDDEW